MANVDFTNPLAGMLTQPATPARIIGIQDGNITYRVEVDINLNEAFARQVMSLALNLYTAIPDREQFVEEKLAELAAQGSSALQSSGQVFSIAPPPPPSSLDLSIIRMQYNQLLQNFKIGEETIHLLGAYASNAINPGSAKLEFRGLEVNIDERSPFQRAVNVVEPQSTYSIAPHLPAVSSEGVEARRPSFENSILPSDDSVTSEREVSYEAITRLGLDPAKINSTEKVVNFIGVGDPLLSSVSSMTYTAPARALPLRSYRYVARNNRVGVDFEIPLSQLNTVDMFFATIKILTAQGTAASTQDMVIPIRHADLKRKFLIPDLPPVLTCYRKDNGDITIEVSQSDKLKGKEISVFRRTIPSSTSVGHDGTGWVQIYRSKIDGFGEARFTDRVAQSDFIMYRALSYSDAGDPCDDFSYRILRPPATANTEGENFSASADFRDPTESPDVVVTVFNVPDGTNIVRVRRYDNTYQSYSDYLAGESAGYDYVNDSRGQANSSHNAVTPGVHPYAFLDTSAQPGRNYTYVPVALKGTTAMVGHAAKIHVPYQVSPAPVTITMTDPVVPDVAGRRTTVEMTVEANFTDFGFNQIKRALSSVGQSELFDEQFRKNRAQFGSAISFLMERENTKTGLTESFGIIEKGTFEDSPETRAQSGVSEPTVGTAYRYRVKAVIASPMSMFPQISQRVKDPTTLAIFEKKISNFSSSILKATGCLPSVTRATDFTKVDRVYQNNDPRLEGMTTVEQVRDFMYAPEPVELVWKGYEEDDDLLVLHWETIGDSREIDHFKISVVTDGGSIVLDRVHCDPNTDRYTYRHFSHTSGCRYSYTITMVDIGYREIAEVRTTTVKPKVMTPSGLIEKNSNDVYLVPPNVRLIRV